MMRASHPAIARRVPASEVTQGPLGGGKASPRKGAAQVIVGIAVTTWEMRAGELENTLHPSGRSVVQVVLRQFFWPSAVGVVLGVSVAAMGSKILRRALYGVSNLDVMSYAGAALFLVGMLLLAALIPARRALRVNVSQALHHQ